MATRVRRGTDFDRAWQEEVSRRRLARLLQVRQQDTRQAARMRQEYLQKVEHTEQRVRDELERNWKREQNRKLDLLQQRIGSHIDAMGQGHRDATSSHSAAVAGAVEQAKQLANMQRAADQRYQVAHGRITKKLKLQEQRREDRKKLREKAIKRARQVRQQLALAAARRQAHAVQPPAVPFKAPPSGVHVERASGVPLLAQRVLKGAAPPPRVDAPVLPAHEDVQSVHARLRQQQRDRDREAQKHREKAQKRGRQAMRGVIERKEKSEVEAALRAADELDRQRKLLLFHRQQTERQRRQQHKARAETFVEEQLLENAFQSAMPSFFPATTSSGGGDDDNSAGGNSVGDEQEAQDRAPAAGPTNNDTAPHHRIVYFTPGGAHEPRNVVLDPATSSSPPTTGAAAGNTAARGDEHTLDSEEKLPVVVETVEEEEEEEEKKGTPPPPAGLPNSSLPQSAESVEDNKQEEEEEEEEVANDPSPNNAAPEPDSTEPAGSEKAAGRQEEAPSEQKHSTGAVHAVDVEDEEENAANPVVPSPHQQQQQQRGLDDTKGSPEEVPAGAQNDLSRLEKHLDLLVNFQWDQVYPDLLQDGMVASGRDPFAAPLSAQLSSLPSESAKPAETTGSHAPRRIDNPSAADAVAIDSDERLAQAFPSATPAEQGDAKGPHEDVAQSPAVGSGSGSVSAGSSEDARLEQLRGAHEALLSALDDAQSFLQTSQERMNETTDWLQRDSQPAPPQPPTSSSYDASRVEPDAKASGPRHVFDAEYLLPHERTQPAAPRPPLQHDPHEYFAQPVETVLDSVTAQREAERAAAKPLRRRPLTDYFDHDYVSAKYGAPPEPDNTRPLARPTAADYFQEYVSPLDRPASTAAAQLAPVAEVSDAGQGVPAAEHKVREEKVPSTDMADWEVVDLTPPDFAGGNDEREDVAARSGPQPQADDFLVVQSPHRPSAAPLDPSYAAEEADRMVDAVASSVVNSLSTAMESTGADNVGQASMPVEASVDISLHEDDIKVDVTNVSVARPNSAQSPPDDELPPPSMEVTAAEKASPAVPAVQQKLEKKKAQMIARLAKRHADRRNRKSKPKAKAKATGKGKQPTRPLPGQRAGSAAAKRRHPPATDQARGPSPGFGARRTLPIQEIRERSKRNFEKLPEVRHARQKKQQKKDLLARLSRARAYSERVRAKKVAKASGSRR